MPRRSWLAGVIAAVASLLLPALAHATTILTLENPGSTTYQQSLNSPCVIGESSCKNPDGFGEGDIPNGSPSSYDVTSPNYTVSQIEGIVGSIFRIGIDVNTAAGQGDAGFASEQLAFFGMFVNDVLQFAYGPFSPGTTLFNLNNGNGRSDALLTGFDLSGFNASDVVTFQAIVNNATDGKEQFFLLGANATPVPEPATVTLLGTGFLGLAAAIRRRRMKGRA